MELVLVGRPVVVLSASADAIGVDEFEVVVVDINVFFLDLYLK